MAISDRCCPISMSQSRHATPMDASLAVRLLRLNRYPGRRAMIFFHASRGESLLRGISIGSSDFSSACHSFSLSAVAEMSPPDAMDTSPLSSDTTTQNVSPSSDTPSAARCRVPYRGGRCSRVDSGRYVAASTTRSFSTMIAPS